MPKLRPFTVGDVNLDLREVTAAERLFIYRHREGMNQTVMARELGISSGLYAQLEGGGRGTLDVETALPLAVAVMMVVPTLPERCLLARRRSGLSIKEVQAMAGVSRPTYYARELSGVAADLWRARGFILEENALQDPETSV